MATLSSVSPAFSISYSHFQHYSVRHRRCVFTSAQDQAQPPISSSATAFPTVSSLPTGSPVTPPVIVVGAGLAGLSAAINLSSAGVPFLLLESSDAAGGRVRTDVVDGFLLDRGFQIFITAYPEARKLLDYPPLKLRSFYSGARVFFDGRFHTVADPTRHPLDSIFSLANPVGSVLDKIRVGLARIRVLARSDEEILSSEPEVQTIQLLRVLGFSDSMIDRFFRPFFGGVFFDRDLETTARLFEFIFKCLAAGNNTIPAEGIQAIPNQLAARLPPGSIRFNSRVLSIDLDDVNKINTLSLTVGGGEVVRCESGLILAVEQPEARRLLAGGKLPKHLKEEEEENGRTRPARKTVCLYFAADQNQIPDTEPILYLNGSGRGIVNNMFFATNVATSYGPPGRALISVSLIGLYDGVSDENLADQVKSELSEWFGESMVASWRLVRVYRVRFAQPNQSPPTDFTKSPRVGSDIGLYLCGDYQTSATFDGALVSGRRAVEQLLKDRVRAV